MMTMPTIYDAIRRHVAAKRAMIVEITDGASTWYISEQAIVLSDLAEPTINILAAVSSISESLDILTREWGTPEAVITIHNKPAFKSGTAADQGMLLRASDVFANVYARTVKIYIYPGEAAGALSDCLQIFSGTVQEFPEITPDTMEIIASAEPEALEIKVPNTFIDEVTYPNAPEGADKRIIPLVYGMISEGDYLNQDGLVPCEQIGPNKWAVADHAVAAVDAVWAFSEELQMWVKLYDSDNYTISNETAPPFRTIIQINSEFPKAHAFIYPDDAYIDNALTPRQLPAKAVDHNSNTHHELICGTTPDAGPYVKTASVILVWTQTLETEDGLATRIGKIFPQNPGPGDTMDRVAIQYKFSFAIGYTNSNNEGMDYSEGYDTVNKRWLPLGEVGGGSVYIAETSASWKVIYLDNGHGPNDWTSITAGINWHLGSGRKDYVGEGNPFALKFILEVNEAASAGTVLGYLREIRLRIPFYFRFRAGLSGSPGGPKTRSVIRQGPRPWMDTDIAVEVDGRKYGWWIQGRNNGKNYTMVDEVQTAPGIIESLLREVAELESDDIDTGSFDAAERWTTINMQVALTGEGKFAGDKDRRPTIKDVIQSICRQNSCAFYYSGVGRARMIDLSINPYYGGATEIPYTDIMPESIVLFKTPTRNIINYMDIEWPRRPQDGKFSHIETHEDETSQGAYGEKIKNVRLENVNDSASVTTYRKWALDNAPFSTRGYFHSMPKNGMRFATRGIKWAHLEIGDWIKMQHEVMDLNYKLAGRTWQSMYMVIVGKETTLRDVRFTAIDPLPIREA